MTDADKDEIRDVLLRVKELPDHTDEEHVYNHTEKDGKIFCDDYGMLDVGTPEFWKYLKEVWVPKFGNGAKINYDTENCLIEFHGDSSAAVVNKYDLIRDGETVEAGYEFSVMKKTDGKWKIHWNMWNKMKK